MELVVTEVEGSVDGLEGFKGDVDLLFLSFIGQDGTTVDDETIGRDWEEGRGGCYVSLIGHRESSARPSEILTPVVQLQPLLRRSNSSQYRQSIDSRLDVRGSTVFLGQHVAKLRDLRLGRNDQTDHGSTSSPSCIKTLYELLDLPDLDVLLLLRGSIGGHAGPKRSMREVQVGSRLGRGGRASSLGGEDR